MSTAEKPCYALPYIPQEETTKLGESLEVDWRMHQHHYRVVEGISVQDPQPYVTLFIPDSQSSHQRTPLIHMSPETAMNLLNYLESQRPALALLTAQTKQNEAFFASDAFKEQIETMKKAHPNRFLAVFDIPDKAEQCEIKVIGQDPPELLHEED